MSDEPYVTIRKVRRGDLHGGWAWRCNRANCGRRGRGFKNHQAALEGAFRHLADDFEKHLEKVTLRPGSIAKRGHVFDSRLGADVAKATERAVENSIYNLIEWLRQELPSLAS
ncbi:hypothetical protein [Streptomyces sp. NPDC126514]|uniref:hypothetical protein n=1 Tax=Streptomyces sp. NPDC126514 TaxID=3155210 RepID=UPI00332371EC